MRTRIATAPAFTGDKVIGAILFEMTMDREISGKPSAKYLWEERRVVPFLKIDKGLEAEENGVQLMKPIPGLSDLLDRAVAHGIFGTKERSVISAANAEGIEAIVAQQFELGQEVLAKGPRADPRAGSHDLDPRQGGGRGHAAGLDPEASRHAGPAGHAETQPAHQGQSLCAPDRASQGAAGRRAVGWLCPRRGERETGREPRHDRELQPRNLPRGCRRSSRTRRSTRPSRRRSTGSTRPRSPEARRGRFPAPLFRRETRGRFATERPAQADLCSIATCPAQPDKPCEINRSRGIPF